MRELRSSELEQVSGALYQESIFDFWWLGGATGEPIYDSDVDAGLVDPNASTPAVLPGVPMVAAPDQIVLPDMPIGMISWPDTLADLQLLLTITEVDLASQQQSQGGQGSSMPNDYDTAPWTFSWGGFSQSSMQNLGFHYFDYLTQDIDPEFLAATSGIAVSGFGQSGFSGNFQGQSGIADFAVQSLGDGSQLITINGMVMQVVERLSAPPPPAIDGTITVAGRTYDVIFAGFAASHNPISQSDTNTSYGIDVATLDIISGQEVNISSLGSLSKQDVIDIGILKATISKVTALLDSLPSAGKITGPDGAIVTVAELRQLWSRADFILDSKGSSAGPGYGNGGVGSADRNGGDPVFRIDFAQLSNYMHQGNDLALHYILHELAHVTSAGYALHQSIGNGAAQEHWTSRIAQAIAGAGGATYAYGSSFVPPAGYGTTGAATWSPS